MLTRTIVPSTMTSCIHVHLSNHKIESAEVCAGICHCFSCREVRGQAMNSDLRGERELDLEEDLDLDRFLHQNQIGDHMLQ